jgi:ABC-type glycerol-3-phosphate transport system substrate-binding protein
VWPYSESQSMRWFMKGASVVLAAVLALAACSSEEKNTEINTEQAPAVAPEPAPVVVDTTGGAPASPHDTMSGMTTPQ